MKKLFPLLFAALIILSVGCKRTTPESVAAKIRENKELTQPEYKCMFETTAQASEAMIDSIRKYSDNATQMLNMMQLYSIDHPELDVFFRQVVEIDPSKLDEANKELYRKTLRNMDVMQEEALKAMGRAVNIGVRPKDLLDELDNPSASSDEKIEIGPVTDSPEANPSTSQFDLPDSDDAFIHEHR